MDEITAPLTKDEEVFTKIARVKLQQSGDNTVRCKTGGQSITLTKTVKARVTSSQASVRTLHERNKNRNSTPLFMSFYLCSCGAFLISLACWICESSADPPETLAPYLCTCLFLWYKVRTIAFDEVTLAFTVFVSVMLWLPFLYLNVLSPDCWSTFDTVLLLLSVVVVCLLLLF